MIQSERGQGIPRDGHRAQRSLTQLAVMLAALTGMVNAIGFLAFGDVFLASPTVNATVFGANLSGRSAIAVLAGSLIVSFVAGVTLTTLATHHATLFRRTLVLSFMTLILLVAYIALSADLTVLPAIFIAIAMGTAHCVFSRDGQTLQEALSPTAQVILLGRGIGGGSNRYGNGTNGMHAIYWLAFAFGGIVGAASWFGLGNNSLLAVSAISCLVVLRTRLIERELPST